MIAREVPILLRKAHPSLQNQLQATISECLTIKYNAMKIILLVGVILWHIIREFFLYMEYSLICFEENSHPLDKVFFVTFLELNF